MKSIYAAIPTSNNLKDPSNKLKQRNQDRIITIQRDLGEHSF